MTSKRWRRFVWLFLSTLLWIQEKLLGIWFFVDPSPLIKLQTAWNLCISYDSDSRIRVRWYSGSFFSEMSFFLQKVDITSRAVLDIMTKTTEYLQPNPGTKRLLTFPNHRTKHWRSCFPVSFQSQAEHDQHHVQDPRAGQGTRIPAGGDHPGRRHVEVWTRAGRGVQLWWVGMTFSGNVPGMLLECSWNSPGMTNSQ